MSDARASGFERIDPRASRLDARRGFVDPRWNDMLARWMCQFEAVSPHDRAGVQGLARVVAQLPFVAEVGEPTVLWPDGIDLPLKLRTPAACVMQGSEYVAVAEDGTILPGRWPSPPWVDTGGEHVGFLPVIGPNDGAFDSSRAGERLTEPRHVDALSVAIEMRAALAKEDFDVLGPPLIDAARAREASVEIPGVVILLEGRRVVWFGRAPNARAPGERPSEKKWADLKRALVLLRGLRQTPRASDARDWSFLDLRWDHPDVTWRDAPEPTSEK
jgi:hypothetical protein